MIPNIAHVPVYNAWGERDTLVARGLDGEPDGTFAEQNRRFADAVFGMGLPFTNVEVPGGVHNSLSPPPEPMRAVLAGQRANDRDGSRTRFATCTRPQATGWRD